MQVALPVRSDREATGVGAPSNVPEQDEQAQPQSVSQVERLAVSRRADRGNSVRFVRARHKRWWPMGKERAT